jgi:hypothetical protein
MGDDDDDALAAAVEAAVASESIALVPTPFSFNAAE